MRTAAATDGYFISSFIVFAFFRFLRLNILPALVVFMQFLEKKSTLFFLAFSVVRRSALGTDNDIILIPEGTGTYRTGFAHIIHISASFYTWLKYIILYYSVFSKEKSASNYILPFFSDSIRRFLSKIQ